ncbi:carboxypeptidase regulatory-like domain-containing protein [Bernardetia sp. OM2101]|uniref:TonB-dependent receptor n=1 Tax=Bernardetia sp. OM2101 TaxID=3344876 RepID=UPI0035CF2D1C
MMKHYILSLIAFVFACSVTFNSFGQGSTTASLSGVVKDKNGEELPGATVLAVHTPTGSQFGTVTSLNGNYSIRNMNVGGPYTITVQYIGYEDNKKENVYLSLGQTLSLDFLLEETVSELAVVTVTSEREIIDGEKTGASTVISTETIDNMPTASRNLADYLRVTPQANVTEGNDGPEISIAGQNNRFNSIFIDGAVSNDVFGLSASGTNGGQTGISPISPDAIEQMEVVVAPYDVTLGNFTGGGINAVTRSGTNKIEGSAYWFTRNENFAGKTPTDTEGVERQKLNDFKSNTFGFRLGGPIVKNKVFFFVNAEMQREEQSQPFPFESFRGDATQADVDQLVNFVSTNYGYDLGGYLDNGRTRDANKVLAKIDWNISQKHKLSLRHSYSFGEELEGQASDPSNINFLRGSELFPSNTNSTTLELKSNLNANMSNKLIVGYTAVRDDRNFEGDPFPRVQIQDGRNNINFGSEPFSIGNELNQDVFILTNNFTIFKDKHTITLGTHNEFYSIYNLFLRENYGVYRYGSLEDFYNDNPNRYVRSYSLLPTVDAQQGDAAKAVAAEFSAAQLGFYVQDEYSATDKLTLTGGLRIDIPLFFDEPTANEGFNANALPEMLQTWAPDVSVSSGTIPSGNVLFSPRFGFNYDIKGDRSVQVRGGLGLFTGRIPFVWPGGAFTNNGVYIASVFANDPLSASAFANGDTTALPFNPDPFDQYTGSDIAITNRDGSISTVSEGASQIDLFADDFKYSQVFRTSLAVDTKLPYGLVGTLEGIYTKNINQILYRNINVKAPVGNVNTSFDNRPVYDGAITRDYDRVLLATNTNEGYSYNITAQIQKPFSGNKMDWSANVAYTYGRSTSVLDGTSSQNSSNWRNTYVTDRNNLELSRSNFDPGHRINLFVSGKATYGDFASTTISLFYNGQSGTPFSYVYAGAIQGDDRSGRDFNNLLFIPENQSQINLIDNIDRDGNLVATAAQQWTELDAFIENDDYLSANRGKYAERNGARLPFQSILDLKLVQDFFITTGSGSRNQLQITFDIFNFSNFLNKEWGRRREMPFDSYAAIDFEGFVDEDNGDFTPQFTFEDGGTAKEVSEIVDTGFYSSRWQMQLGVRYIFK